MGSADPAPRIWRRLSAKPAGPTVSAADTAKRSFKLSLLALDREQMASNGQEIKAYHAGSAPPLQLTPEPQPAGASSCSSAAAVSQPRLLIPQPQACHSPAALQRSQVANSPRSALKALQPRRPPPPPPLPPSLSAESLDMITLIEPEECSSDSGISTSQPQPHLQEHCQPQLALPPQQAQPYQYMRLA